MRNSLGPWSLVLGACAVLAGGYSPARANADVVEATALARDIVIYGSSPAAISAATCTVLAPIPRLGTFIIRERRTSS